MRDRRPVLPRAAHPLRHREIGTNNLAGVNPKAGAEEQQRCDRWDRATQFHEADRGLVDAGQVRQLPAASCRAHAAGPAASPRWPGCAG